MFQLISGHLQAHNWSSRHTEEEIYITYWGRNIY